MTSPAIIKGFHTEGPYQYQYAGLQLGKLQYRIYEDRAGWFIDGEYSAIPPKGKSATQIRRAIDQAGRQAFLDYLFDRMEKWKLKELAGI